MFAPLRAHHLRLLRGKFYQHLKITLGQRVPVSRDEFHQANID
ncbi:MAG: hypothetical protein JG782_1210 [Anaerophaga sp.]|nr:hypothetical protein [Anaerophaga sp.]